MKRLIAVVTALLVMGLAGTALATGTLSGKYKQTISGDSALGGALNATWVLKVHNGKYHVTRNGSPVVHGTYTISGDDVTVSGGTGAGGCGHSGTYKFTITGNKVKFTVVSDSNPACVGRKDVLTHGKWKKI